MIDCKNSHNLSSHLCPCLFAMEVCSSFHQEQSILLGWPSDSLWPIERGRSSNLSVLRLDLKTLCILYCHNHESKSGLACWRKRDHKEQKQDHPRLANPQYLPLRLVKTIARLSPAQIDNLQNCKLNRW